MYLNQFSNPVDELFENPRWRYFKKHFGVKTFQFFI